MRCEKHSRRVVGVTKSQTETVFVHRNGDGSKCDSSVIVCGTRRYSVNPWRLLDKTPEEESMLEMVAIINRIADREAERILRNNALDHPLCR